MNEPAPDGRPQMGSIPRPSLGVYTRFMVRHHLWFIVVTLMSISSAVTAINVSGEIVRVWAEQSVAGAFNAVVMTGYYVVLRLLDNTAQALPISVVLALVWAETSHAASGRLVMVRTVGMDFWLRSRGLLVAALLIVAPAQFAFDNFIRPHAMLELKRNVLGEYGWLHQSEQSKQMQWFALDGNVVQTMMEGIPDATITDVTVYEFEAGASLLSITHAERLGYVPDSRSAWTLDEAHSWRLGEADVGAKAVDQSALPPDLQLSKTWLRYRGIHPKYVPLADLVSLSWDKELPDDYPPYAQWLALRLVQPINTVLILLCTAALFALALDRRGLIVAAMSGLVTGYLLYLLSRISAVLVESVGISPFLTGALLPLGLAGLLMLISRVLTEKDRAG